MAAGCRCSGRDRRGGGGPDWVYGKRIVGDRNPRHFQNALHYHVHDVETEKRACEIQQIIDAGHVKTFDPDTVSQAASDGYVRCEHCLGGQHCGY
jgi:hypothetical protein